MDVCLKSILENEAKSPHCGEIPFLYDFASQRTLCKILFGVNVCKKHSKWCSFARCFVNLCSVDLFEKSEPETLSNLVYRQ